MAIQQTKTTRNNSPPKIGVGEIKIEKRKQNAIPYIGLEPSSLGSSGSMDTITLPTICPASASEENGGGGWCWLFCMARETTGGHFISHTCRSALLVSKWILSLVEVAAAAAAAGAAFLAS
ncbi:hypothetical protein MIMGU_mgv1a016474mg [Erythranthe guttata]|uniref:Uncharacterized protein n=1 Tax=Erythranthe guttata TaxID=4155 RepID=A0A022RLK7_ERYGU|nr:hypothetical protein MIMGU_mgv1a016474mg [Erythranthe guttata]